VRSKSKIKLQCNHEIQIGEVMTLPQYEIFALRYGTMAKRSRRENFITQDPHDEPMPMDYFVWVVRNAERTILVDTGFSARQAKERGRTLLRCPIESLSLLGIAPEDIQDVVLTHLHYDHAGNIDLLPNARFHVQDGEVDYACGRHMCHGLFRHAYDIEDVVSLIRRLYANRVVFHDGRQELAPGIELIKIGGHTKGLQSLRVHTARGWVVLASDASHYYDNMEKPSPFPIVFHIGEMLAGYDTLRAAAESSHHIIPGHDPQVRERYSFHGNPADDIVALHQPPKA
jgi:glyoxylase-like metal-dependent hydrolase (beta-lactamase superfamily II)